MSETPTPHLPLIMVAAATMEGTAPSPSVTSITIVDRRAQRSAAAKKGWETRRLRMLENPLFELHKMWVIEDGNWAAQKQLHEQIDAYGAQLKANALRFDDYARAIEQMIRLLVDRHKRMNQERATMRTLITAVLKARAANTLPSQRSAKDNHHKHERKIIIP